MSKIILDLCGGTGSWSKPYKDAGYDVRVITLPDWSVEQWNKYDVKPLKELIFLHQSHAPGSAQVIPISEVYGILAAPPCTMFSLARTTAKTPRDLSKGMQTVEACLEIIWAIRKSGKLGFWAMENPKALLRQFLGRPPFSFDASEFGEGYNKATDIWGYFKEPRKTAPFTHYAETTRLNTRALPEIPDDYKRDWEMSARQVRRSITPQGFAKAFYEANK